MSGLFSSGLSHVGKCLAVVAIGFALVNSAYGGILTGLQLPAPDIHSTDIAIVYNAGSGLFTAVGTPQDLELGGGTPPEVTYGDLTRSFNLQAIIANNGNDVSGSITIKASTSTTLLTGTLLDFDFLSGPGVATFNFLFTTDGGDLADEFGGVGSRFGVILSSSNGDGLGPVSFAANFNNNGAAESDTFAVAPEPATLAMWGCFVVGAAVRYRSRTRRRS